MSDRERKLLDALVNAGSVKDATYFIRYSHPRGDLPGSEALQESARTGEIHRIPLAEGEGYAVKRKSLLHRLIEKEDAWRFRERYLGFLPLRFTCSGCGKEVIRDLTKYCAFISLPDPSKKCLTCGHVPIVWFAYCSSECFAETNSDQALERRRLEEEEIKKIMMTFKNIDREIAYTAYMEHGGFRNGRVVHPAWDDWKEPSGKPTFHKEFPRLARRKGFRVYKQGWPDYLIEKDGKYMGVEVKEGNGLGEHQWLMHQALERAGLKVVLITPDIIHLLDNYYNCLNQ